MYLLNMKQAVSPVCCPLSEDKMNTEAIISESDVTYTVAQMKQ